MKHKHNLTTRLVKYDDGQHSYLRTILSTVYFSAVSLHVHSQYQYILTQLIK